MAALGEHGLGVELDALDRQVAVPGGHDHAGLGPGGHLQLVGDAVLRDGQRVVPGRGERRRQPGEHAGALVEHLAGLAVQQLVGATDHTAVRDADRLQAEADAEDRHLATRLLDDVDAGAGLFRRSGTGREQDAVVRRDLVRSDLVVAQHGGVGLQLLQVLHQVVDEGVVVVDDEDPRHATHCDRLSDHRWPTGWRSASGRSRARSRSAGPGCPRRPASRSRTRSSRRSPSWNFTT